MSRQRKPGWTFASEIQLYIPPDFIDCYEQVRKELVDPSFRSLDHGQRATYKRGCTGPLCRKAMRDYGRQYQRNRMGHTKTLPSPRQRFDEMLVLLTMHHMQTRAVHKLQEFERRHAASIINAVDIQRLRSGRRALSA